LKKIYFIFLMMTSINFLYAENTDSILTNFHGRYEFKEKRIFNDGIMNSEPEAMIEDFMTVMEYTEMTMGIFVFSITEKKLQLMDVKKYPILYRVEDNKLLILSSESAESYFYIDLESSDLSGTIYMYQYDGEIDQILTQSVLQRIG